MTHVDWYRCVPSQTVLRELLDPRHWNAPEDRRFVLDASQIAELCDQAESIFREETSVLKLRGALSGESKP